MHTTQHKFTIDDPCTIVLTGNPGRVDSISIGRHETLYWVEYADANGLVTGKYFRESELS